MYRVLESDDSCRGRRDVEEDIEREKETATAHHSAWNRGYGKSHVLTTLALVDFRPQRRVAISPDAAQCPRAYLRKVFVLLFFDDYLAVDLIMGFRQLKDDQDFVAEFTTKGELRFMIDKMNALGAQVDLSPADNTHRANIKR